MAIRNTNLGGTDWTTGEVPFKAADLNDTFDAAVNIIQQSPAFYLSSTLYDVYDNFDGYSVGNPPSSTLWTFLYSENDPASDATSTYSVSSTTNAGGTTNELVVGVTQTGNFGSSLYYARSTLKAIALTANRHTWMRIYSVASGGGNSEKFGTYISFDGGSTYHDLATNFTGASNCQSYNYLQVLIVAKGSNEYDCYVGGKLLQNVTDASFEIWFHARTGDDASNTTSGNTAYLAGNKLIYIDDVRQSKVDIA